MVKKVRLADMTWPEVAEARESGARVVIIPVGATEQHGHHLPLSTDIVMAETVARLAAERAGGVLVAPGIPYGTSENHLAFPGTTSVRLDTLKALLVDAGCTLASHGFDVIVILNGHAGNTAAIAAAAHELRQMTDRVVAALTWWFFVEQALGVLEDTYVWHAGEFETALMLYLHPELVQMDKAQAETPRAMPLHPFTGVPGLPKVDLGVVPTDAVVASGTFGDARLATAEKGKACVEEALDRLVCVLQELRTHGEEIRQRSGGDRTPSAERRISRAT